MLKSVIMTKKRGQVAQEYLFITFFFLVFTMVALTIFSIISSQKQTQNKILSISDMGRGIEHELYAAAQVPDGYYREFFIPRNYNGVMLQIDQYEKSFEIGDDKFKEVFPIPRINGNLRIGRNIIEKNAGEVCLNVAC